MDCVKCGNEIPPLRLKALPNTTTCIGCSGVKAKKAQTKTYGEKDHTWNDIEFIEDE